MPWHWHAQTWGEMPRWPWSCTHSWNLHKAFRAVCAWACETLCKGSCRGAEAKGTQRGESVRCQRGRISCCQRSFGFWRLEGWVPMALEALFAYQLVGVALLPLAAEESCSRRRRAQIYWSPWLKSRQVCPRQRKILSTCIGAILEEGSCYPDCLWALPLTWFCSNTPNIADDPTRDTQLRATDSFSLADLLPPERFKYLHSTGLSRPAAGWVRLALLVLLQGVEAEQP